MTKALQEIWLELKNAGVPDTARRVFPDSLASQYAAVDSTFRYSYLVVSECEPFNPEPIDAIEVIRIQKSDSSWVLKITLEIPDLAREFETLCEDLGNASLGGSTEAQALALMEASYSDWIRFFKISSQMSLRTARGLFAELWVVSDFMRQGLQDSLTIESWLGPMKADQDFIFPNGKGVEVKSITPSAVEVHIANESQLDLTSGLYLVVVEVGQTPDMQIGECINDQVARISENLTTQARTAFIKKLKLAGYREEQFFCSKVNFYVLSSSVFNVMAPTFPKVTKAELPKGISKVSYSLNLSEIRHFLEGSADDLTTKLF